MLHFVSVFEKERLKGIYLFLYYKLFFGLLVFSFTIYVIRFKRTERNILRIKRAHCKTNTAVYLYDHWMIIVIVLTATVFIAFNHAKNKKIR